MKYRNIYCTINNCVVNSTNRDKQVSLYQTLMRKQCMYMYVCVKFNYKLVHIYVRQLSYCCRLNFDYSDSDLKTKIVFLLCVWRLKRSSDRLLIAEIKRSMNDSATNINQEHTQ